MATIPTTLMEKDGEEMTVNMTDIAKYEDRGWSVSENQPESVETEAPADESEVSSNDTESTSEDKKKIDEFIAEAETEKVIDPEHQAEVQPEQPVQPKQPEPEQPEIEDEVVMPAE